MNLFRKFRRDEGQAQVLIERAVEEAERGRRLAIYDRASGLFAFWYWRLRFQEEVERYDRYKRDLTFLLLESPPGDSFNTHDAVSLWLNDNLRASDLFTHLGDGRFMVLLAETNRESATLFASRLEALFPGTGTGVAAYPEDGKTVAEIQTTASRRFSAKG